jgi:hypothetical protein
MSNNFPFGWMNTWTDFLASVYEVASRHATKHPVLDRITFMAFDKGQHYSVIKLKEMLSTFHFDKDIDVAISVARVSNSLVVASDTGFEGVDFNRL